MRRLILTLVLAIVPAASAQAASFTGHGNGYRLTFRPGQQLAVLDLPAPAARLTAFQVSCGKTRHGSRESVIAFAPLSTSSRLSGPLDSWPPKNRWCTIKRNMHKVAGVHLVR